VLIAPANLLFFDRYKLTGYRTLSQIEGKQALLATSNDSASALFKKNPHRYQNIPLFKLELEN
jgi:hypothetical protein